MIQKSLDKQISIIKNYEKSVIGSILDIGKVLAQIHQTKSYREKYSSFEECVENNFTFTRQYAYKYIELFKKYGQNVKQFDKIKPYGMRVLIMSLYVPDDRLDELIEVIQDPPLKDHTSLAKQIKRFAKEVGEKPRYEENLEEEEKKPERLLKAKREGEGIKEKYQEFLDIKTSLKLAIENWLNLYKYEELNALKEDLQSIKKYLN